MPNFGNYTNKNDLPSTSDVKAVPSSSDIEASGSNDTSEKRMNLSSSSSGALQSEVSTYTTLANSENGRCYSSMAAISRNSASKELPCAELNSLDSITTAKAGIRNSGGSREYTKSLSYDTTTYLTRKMELNNAASNGDTSGVFAKPSVSIFNYLVQYYKLCIFFTK